MPVSTCDSGKLAVLYYRSNNRSVLATAHAPESAKSDGNAFQTYESMLQPQTRQSEPYPTKMAQFRTIRTPLRDGAHFLRYNHRLCPCHPNDTRRVANLGDLSGCQLFLACDEERLKSSVCILSVCELL